jgi:short subunit dehydrogenase-like uncharacterized protein
MTEFDVVVFGASGFTGRLVAEYLRDHGGGARWAVAGRDLTKLEKVAQGAPILMADATDPASLRSIAKQTRVVCTTVGPYAKYGTPLVEAAVEAGIAYCDLSGEPHWIREMIRRHHRRATETGARIVHCCGFDSIPSDLGVLMLADHASTKYGQGLAHVRTRVMRMHGRASGGTMHTALGILRAAGRPSTLRAIADPYTFDPEDGRRGADRRERLLPSRDRDRGRWTVVFPMSFINSRVVRRSNALMDHRYGEAFTYEERIDTGSGSKGFSRALRTSLALGGFAAAGWLPGTRDLLKRFLPHPGEGPDLERRERGSFAIELLAKSDGSPSITLKGTVAAQGDPGYAASSRMLGESALCLALDGIEARGVVTPAVAMGSALIARLRRAGMTFEVTESR